MSDINPTNKKWKYTDLDFCKSVDKKLEEEEETNFVDNSEGFPNLTAIVQRKKQMEKDVCSVCDETRFKNCKCYKNPTPSPDKTNDVFCGMISDGAYYACPEKCCGDDGCREPDRDGEPVTAPEVQPDISEEQSSDTGDDETSLIEDMSTIDIFEWLLIILSVGIVVGALAYGGYLMYKSSKKKSNK